MCSNVFLIGKVIPDNSVQPWPLALVMVHPSRCPTHWHMYFLACLNSHFWHFLQYFSFPALFWLINVPLVALVWWCHLGWWQECHGCHLSPQEIYVSLALPTCKGPAPKLMSCNIYKHLDSFFFFLIEQYFVPIAHLGDTCVANLNRTLLSALLGHLNNAYQASLLEHILHSLLSSRRTW